MTLFQYTNERINNADLLKYMNQASNRIEQIKDELQFADESDAAKLQDEFLHYAQFLGLNYPELNKKKRIFDNEKIQNKV